MFAFKQETSVDASALVPAVASCKNKRNERKVYYLIRIWNGKGWKKGLRESLSEVQKGAGILRISDALPSSEAVDFFLLRVLLLFVHHLTFRTRIERAATANTSTTIVAGRGLIA
ncbi:hypothetical protein ACJX0J_001713 (mitochondrion) [Zea mays]